MQQQNLHCPDRKITVGVFFGGISLEREVSFNSGRTICDHLDTGRYNALPIFIAQTRELFILPERFLHRGKTTDFEHRLSAEAERISWDELPHRIDFAFIALHGRWYEDGALQGMFELLKVPYFGSKVFASAIGMNKILQKAMLAAAGINVPPSVTVPLNVIKSMVLTRELPESVAAATGAVGYPVVVKPVQEGSSFGVTKVNKQEELLPALLQAATITPQLLQPVLIERALNGMEFTCIIITDLVTGEPIALPPTEVIPEVAQGIFTYEEKYMPGRAHKATPARCTPEALHAIQTTCIAAMRALGCTTFARIDGFLTAEGEVFIIDPNTLGGMAPASFAFLQAAEKGMSHTAFINHLVDAELIAAGILPPPVPDRSTVQQPTDHRLRVAVIMGGASAEREISLESGRNVTYKLSPHKYEAIPLFLSSKLELFKLDQKLLVKNSTKEIEALLTPESKALWSELPNIADFVFIGLHGGHGENGSVQGALELLGLPYNGSSVATSALCMDKYKTTIFLHQQGFNVPHSFLLNKQQWTAGCNLAHLMQEHQLSFPLIVKPHDDGCSVLVQKARTMEELNIALATLYESGRTEALIEDCINGMELTVGVVGNEEPYALPPSYAVATQGILSLEEKFLPGAGENQTPAPLPPETITFVQEELCRVYLALQCRGYARIDCFYQSASQSGTGREQLVILEVNTLPGLTPATCIFHQAAEIGIKPMDFIDMIVTYGLAAHAGQTRPTTVPTAQNREMPFATNERHHL